MAGFRKTVMWVDDEIEMLRAHVMFLETRGYHVVPVFTGDDAVQLMTDRPRDFDIVLLDEQMPGKDGLTTLEEIKELRPDLPVVMVTKSEEERLMEQAIGKKIDGYLTKPVNPSQILLVCKRLLDSKTFIASEIKQQFLRSYSENTTALRGRLETNQWVKLYENLARWDAELDKVDDEGLRQTHAGQKSDSNTTFANFIEEHYGRWIKGDGKPPVMSVSALKHHVFPLLNGDRQVYLIICSGMRLDQYLKIESVLRALYAVQRNYFFSILPTDTMFARASLLAGLYPIEVEERFPDAWDQYLKGSAAVASLELKLLKSNLQSQGIKLGNGIHYRHLHETDAVSGELKKHAKSRLIVMVNDAVHNLASGCMLPSLSGDIARDERALRSLTATWFEHSQLCQLLRELATRECTVVITSDHGHVFCTRKTEMYGARQLEPGVRYKFGKQITADDRRVVSLNDPRHFKLPRLKRAPICLIAKDNYYFSQPEGVKERIIENRNTFQRGGISLEEMVVPLAVFTPL
ncbi:MAG: response regulator [Chitinispirillaceae bacterium]|nr:response regulator [Chitinispirillaceae bacterium]